MLQTNTCRWKRKAQKNLQGSTDVAAWLRRETVLFHPSHSVKQKGDSTVETGATNIYKWWFSIAYLCNNFPEGIHYSQWYLAVCLLSPDSDFQASDGFVARHTSKSNGLNFKYHISPLSKSMYIYIHMFYVICFIYVLYMYNIWMILIMTPRCEGNTWNDGWLGFVRSSQDYSARCCWGTPKNPNLRLRSAMTNWCVRTIAAWERVGLRSLSHRLVGSPEHEGLGTWPFSRVLGSWVYQGLPGFTRGCLRYG